MDVTGLVFVKGIVIHRPLSSKIKLVRRRAIRHRTRARFMRRHP